MELHGKKVVLRAVEEEDLEMLRELTNDPNFEKMVVGWAFPISKKDQSEWFANCKNSLSVIRYTIVTKEDGPIGMIGLKDIDLKNGVASGLGIRIAEKKMRSKGLATDAQMTLMRYAFNELRLNRINGSVLAYNQASLRLTEKVGYKVEGIKREAVFKNGEFIDLIMIGCLKSDYEALIAENHYWD